MSRRPTVPPTVRNMSGDVLGGGVVVALAAALWLAYLIPVWLRRREYLATERNAVRLQQTLRILAETSELPDAVRYEATARTVAEQQRILRRAEERVKADARAAAEADARRERAVAEAQTGRRRRSGAGRPRRHRTRTRFPGGRRQDRAPASSPRPPAVAVPLRRRLRRSRATTSRDAPGRSPRDDRRGRAARDGRDVAAARGIRSRRRRQHRDARPPRPRTSPPRRRRARSPWRRSPHSSTTTPTTRSFPRHVRPGLRSRFRSRCTSRVARSPRVRWRRSMRRQSCAAPRLAPTSRSGPRVSLPRSRRFGRPYRSQSPAAGGTGHRRSGFGTRASAHAGSDPRFAAHGTHRRRRCFVDRSRRRPAPTPRRRLVFLSSNSCRSGCYRS